MGQAKRRGTFEQRRATAILNQHVPMEVAETATANKPTPSRFNRRRQSALMSAAVIAAAMMPGR